MVKRVKASYRPAPSLLCPHPYHVLNRVDEDLAVPSFARLSILADDVDDRLSILVIDHHFQLYLWEELHPVASGPPLQGDALLPAPALDLGDGHSRKALLVELVSQNVQLFRPNYGFNLLHLPHLTCKRLRRAG